MVRFCLFFDISWQMKPINGLESIPSVYFVLSSFSWERLIPKRRWCKQRRHHEAEKKDEPFRKMIETLGLARLRNWYIDKKKECTGELSNTKRPGRAQTTAVVDDHRIQEGVTSSKSTTKRRLHGCKYRGFTKLWLGLGLTATEGRCSKGLVEHLRGWNSGFIDVHGFKPSSRHWLQRIFIQVLKIILANIIMLICTITEPLKIKDYVWEWM